MGRRKGRGPHERVEAEMPLFRATLGVTGAVSRTPRQLRLSEPATAAGCGDSLSESVTGHAGAL